MNNYEGFRYYDADKTSESGGATGGVVDGKGNGHYALPDRTILEMPPGSEVLLRAPVNPHNGESNPSEVLNELQNQLTEKEAQHDEAMKKLTERVQALEEENKRINELLTNIVSGLENVNTQFANLSAQIDTSKEENKKEMQGIRDEVARMSELVQNLVNNFPPKPQEKKAEEKPAENQGTKSPEPKTRRTRSKTSPKNGNKAGAKDGDPSGGQKPTDIWVKPLRGSYSSSEDQDVVEENIRVITDIQVTHGQTGEEEFAPLVIEEKHEDEGYRIIRTLDPSTGDIEAKKYDEADFAEPGKPGEPAPTPTKTDGPKKGGMFQRMGEFGRAFHQKGGEVVQKTDDFFDTIHYKGGQLVTKADAYLDKLWPRRKKKDVDHGTFPVDPNASVVPPREAARVLTPDQQEEYLQKADDTFLKLYHDVFLGDRSKDELSGEKFIGTFPYALGLLGMAAPVTVLSSALAAAGTTIFVAEGRRNFIKENISDQFTRFSFVEGRPSTRMHQTIQLLQRLGRSPERRMLKYSLGLNDFKGSRHVQRLVRYIGENDELNVPQSILEDQKQVDKLLTEATWYLNSAKAINDLGAYLHDHERNNYNENWPKVELARNTLLNKVYWEPVKRADFADRLYEKLSKRENRVFHVQVASLAGIEGAKACVIGAIPLAYTATTGYIGSVASRAESHIAWDQVQISLEGIKNNTQNAWDVTTRFFSDGAAVFQSDIHDKWNNLSVPVIDAWNNAREWVSTQWGAITVGQATQQIEGLRSAIEAEGGAGAGGSGINATLEWLREFRDSNRILRWDECGTLYRALHGYPPL